MKTKMNPVKSIITLGVHINDAFVLNLSFFFIFNIMQFEFHNSFEYSISNCVLNDFLHTYQFLKFQKNVRMTKIITSYEIGKAFFRQSAISKLRM